MQRGGHVDGRHMALDERAQERWLAVLITQRNPSVLLSRTSHERLKMVYRSVKQLRKRTLQCRGASAGEPCADNLELNGRRL